MAHLAHLLDELRPRVLCLKKLPDRARRWVLRVNSSDGLNMVPKLCVHLHSLGNAAPRTLLMREHEELVLKVDCTQRGVFQDVVTVRELPPWQCPDMERGCRDGDTTDCALFPRASQSRRLLLGHKQSVVGLLQCSSGTGSRVVREDAVLPRASPSLLSSSRLVDEGLREELLLQQLD